ncbi:relaxase/mobilization nuclease domain-containing protein [Pseudomonas putida]|uniref:relaxase/mobilization nuclease domain-containing protein n=1 Tax=Pseudomonas putida TaxID=303 RepID=UPI0007517FCC|nr:relaxase/mobilization nuclease domain-containing protein [Pseudomonas putida]
MMHGLSVHTQSATSAVGYFLDALYQDKTTGAWHERDPAPELIEGDPGQMTALCDALSFKHHYTTGVLAFSKNDTAKLAATPGLKEQLIEELREFAYAGVTQDDCKPLFIVEHGHKGNVELHYLIPRVNLESGKYFNPFPPNYNGKRGPGNNQDFIEQNDTFIDYISSKYGLDNPRHPDFAREIKIAPFDPEAADKKTINELIGLKIVSGEVKSRADIVDVLKKQGGTITRLGKDYISVKFSENSKAIRLRGGVYGDESFAEIRAGFEAARAHFDLPPEFHEARYREVQAFRAEEVGSRHNLKGLAAERAGDFDRKSARELGDYADELKSLKDSLPGYDEHRSRVSAALASDPVLASGDGPAGIEVGLASGSSGAEPIMTGDKGSDELIRAFAKMQKKLAAEDIQRAKSRWQIDPKQEQMIRDISDTLSKLFTGLATGKNLVHGRPGAMTPADIAEVRREIQVQRHQLQRELKAVAQVVKQKERTEPLRDILDKPKAFEAKAAPTLAKLVDKNAVLRPGDMKEIGGIESLRSRWLSDKVAAVRDDTFFWKQKPDSAEIERGVVGAMARQNVQPQQAFRAVLEDSGVGRGDAQHAARVVAQEYTRAALIREGKPVADLESEAQKRHPDLYKRAESGVDAERKREAAERAQEAQLEQQRLDAEAERKRALEVLERAAEAKKSSDFTLG